MYVYTCTEFILYNVYGLTITTCGDGNGTEEVTDLVAIFYCRRRCKCNKCEIKVPRRGQSTKMFTPTNLVHHLKIKPGHEEEYERYLKLKKENDEKTESSVTATSDGMKLRQVSLQGTVELRKIWDINDSRAK